MPLVPGVGMLTRLDIDVPAYAAPVGAIVLHNVDAGGSTHGVGRIDLVRIGESVVHACLYEPKGLAVVDRVDAFRIFNADKGLYDESPGWFPLAQALAVFLDRNAYVGRQPRTAYCKKVVRAHDGTVRACLVLSSLYVHDADDRYLEWDVTLRVVPEALHRFALGFAELK